MQSSNNHPVTGEVIVMEQFRNGRSLGPLKQAEAYWTSLRKGHEIPLRSDIDPRGIENLLEYAFIIERVAPGVARFRLAGQHLNALMGMDVRGMPLTAFFTPQARPHVSATLENMFEKPAVAEMDLKGESRRGRTPYEARLLILPLRSDTGEVTRALGVLVSDGAVSTVPARFNVMEVGLRPTNGQAGGRVELQVTQTIRSAETTPRTTATDTTATSTTATATTDQSTPGSKNPGMPQVTPAPRLQTPASQKSAPASGFAESTQDTITKPGATKRRPPYLRVVK